jgi:hypothetical protein
LEFRLTVSVTLAPGAPEPPERESEGVCADARSAIAAVAHRKRTILKCRALITRAGFAI